MKTYKVWVFPVLSVELAAASEDEARAIASEMKPEDFKEHTDMCEMGVEEVKNDR